jgi:hypothetical protein
MSTYLKHIKPCSISHKIWWNISWRNTRHDSFGVGHCPFVSEDFFLTAGQHQLEEINCRIGLKNYSAGPVRKRRKKSRSAVVFTPRQSEIVWKRHFCRNNLSTVSKQSNRARWKRSTWRLRVNTNTVPFLYRLQTKHLGSQNSKFECFSFKDDVHSCAHVRTLFTFWTAIFVKYDILTEYLTLFWFAMLVNEYKLCVSIQKSSKDAKFAQCLYLGVPLCYEQNWCAERSGNHL